MRCYSLSVVWTFSVLQSFPETCDQSSNKKVRNSPKSEVFRVTSFLLEKFLNLRLIPSSTFLTSFSEVAHAQNSGVSRSPAFRVLTQWGNSIRHCFRSFWGTKTNLNSAAAFSHIICMWNWWPGTTGFTVKFFPGRGMKFYLLGEGRVGEGYGNCAKFSNKTKKISCCFGYLEKKPRKCYKNHLF